MTSIPYDMYDDHRNGNEKDSQAGSPFWIVGFRYEKILILDWNQGQNINLYHIFHLIFHCKSDITNWKDSEELNGGLISGNLADLNAEKEGVQQRIADYFVELLSWFFWFKYSEYKTYLSKIFCK